ncbi:VWA domain-containing protein [Puniceibacterium sediminis]|uniref:Ca-activated chloride channel family protein n=1 Tax=Puniceibacterium sediminis TaxID=1608407 RepID=A0A238YZ15_9RHOB|nr:VWA domain-containing protein [Puniceibacterium sediminis]SNR75938.1 Ca-activated chloride channel family protein [Puniceibacterium sediminis]
MTFAAPLALLLLPLPLLALFLPPEKLRHGAMTLPPAILAQARDAVSGRAARHLGLVALTLAWICAVLALSGPRILVTLDTLPATGRDIVLVLDLSGSMEKEDFDIDGTRVSRLAAVQSVAAQFVRGRVGDRVGLVVFGDRAYVAAAPTHDVSAVAQVIETSVIGVSGKATAIADGLGLAIKRLRDRDAKSKVVILLSDGRDTSGVVDPVAAAKKASELGIRIHTIALGPDDAGTAARPDDVVDTETLDQIAATAGGEMFRVRTTQDLSAVTRSIDQLEPSAAAAPPITAWRELWIWPAAAALVMLLGLLCARPGAAT